MGFRGVETQWNLLTVASAAIREAANAVLLHELWSENGLIRGSPSHIGYFIDWPDEPFWMAMTIEAKAHGQTGNLINSSHLIHATVASDAAKTFVRMNGVIEVDKIRHVVHSIPRNGRS